MESLQKESDPVKVGIKVKELPPIKIEFPSIENKNYSPRPKTEKLTGGESFQEDNILKNELEDLNKTPLLISGNVAKQYPSYINIWQELDKLNYVLKSVSDIGTLATLTAIPASFYLNISPDTLATAMATSVTSIVVLKAIEKSRLITNGLSRILAKKEILNRVDVSQIMTVSKAFNESGSTTDNLIKAISTKPDSTENFYGELHFVGGQVKKKFGILGPYIKEDRVNRIVDAFEGLSNLAKMCSDNDPRITGINYFIGSSFIITPSFEKYGFRVFEEKSIENRSPIQKFYDWIDKEKQKGKIKKDPNQYYAVIDRESLIRNRERYNQIISRLSQ